MIRAVWSITQNAEDAEEAFQEALGTIWRRWDRITVHPNAPALVLRICVNAAYDVLRRKIRRRRWQEAFMLWYRSAPVTRPDRAAELGEQESAVIHALGQLSRCQAVAIFLRFIQGQSYTDIAQVLECEESTVRKHVERGRARLRELLAHLAPPRHEEKLG